MPGFDLTFFPELGHRQNFPEECQLRWMRGKPAVFFLFQLFLPWERNRSIR